MADNKNTPQNVNKSPDKKKPATKEGKNPGKSTSAKKSRPSAGKVKGIGGTQIGT